jgi:hypothetical protein
MLRPPALLRSPARPPTGARASAWDPCYGRDDGLRHHRAMTWRLPRPRVPSRRAQDDRRMNVAIENAHMSHTTKVNLSMVIEFICRSYCRGACFSWAFRTVTSPAYSLARRSNVSRVSSPATSIARAA